MDNSLVGCRILVVEDDPLDAVTIGDAFRAGGAHVVMTYSVPEALVLLTQDQWSLAVVNYSPGDEVAEFCAEIVKADIPFLISAHETTLKGNAGWGVRIRRPVDIDELLTAAAALL